MLRRYWMFFGLLAVSALIFVACGGDDDDDTDSDTGGAATATATSETESAIATATTVAVSTVVPSPTAAAEDQLLEAILVIPEPRDDAIPRNGRVLGNADASVSIIEYGDFQ